MLQGHGDDSYRYSKKIIANFSTNVWYGGEPLGLKEYIFEQWSAINRYPEVMAESLCEMVAAHHDLKSDQILINSGTTESIYLIAQAFSCKKTTIITPAFAEYEDACKLFQHDLTFLPWSKIREFPTLSTDLVFICNPNNPTGEAFTQLENWIQQNPQTLFVVDEAFIDFTLQIRSSIPVINRFPNLLIMHSLTKAYAIPGLRLGYVVASEDLISNLKSIKQPWTVNTMALQAGKFIFENYQQIQIPLQNLLSEKERISQRLGQNSSLKIHESATHFFLAETLKDDAAKLKQFLIEKHGLLIRDASNFRDLSKRHFRIATLSPERNNLLIEALDEWRNY
ncbi:pyridoxal phosphate-dependent class II aminotransferase [Dyadobacter sp. CY345]|uniref:pyridoxal phosphate-dependent aminotransferase n=1 Tax=Dyadobacter sp. CY345 TaxID=2909335 RepID=UPI001F2164B2|nr:threonine-phosphate decarboxylase [Dyadobacter sp. CY345]MCF2446250.1 pyridoxal phosphate-dependent class II aminotransferase [Dyadobacter sp. CY345]